MKTLRNLPFALALVSLLPIACDDSTEDSSPAASAPGAGKADDAGDSLDLSNAECLDFEACSDEEGCLDEVTLGELNEADHLDAFVDVCCGLTNYAFCYDFGAFNCGIEQEEFVACLETAESDQDEAYCIERTEAPGVFEGMVDCCGAGDYAFCEYVEDPEDGLVCALAQDEFDDCVNLYDEPRCASYIEDTYEGYAFECCGDANESRIQTLCE